MTSSQTSAPTSTSLKLTCAQTLAKESACICEHCTEAASVLEGVVGQFEELSGPVSLMSSDYGQLVAQLELELEEHQRTVYSLLAGDDVDLEDVQSLYRFVHLLQSFDDALSTLKVAEVEWYESRSDNDDDPAMQTDGDDDSAFFDYEDDELSALDEAEEQAEKSASKFAEALDILSSLLAAPAKAEEVREEIARSRKHQADTETAATYIRELLADEEDEDSIGLEISVHIGASVLVQSAERAGVDIETFIEAQRAARAVIDEATASDATETAQEADAATNHADDTAAQPV